MLITNIIKGMKKSIAKVFLGTVIMLGILWVGCEDVAGKMSWSFVLSKVAALGVISLCAYFLDRIYKGEKKTANNESDK